MGGGGFKGRLDFFQKTSKLEITGTPYLGSRQSQIAFEPVTSNQTILGLLISRITPMSRDFHHFSEKRRKNIKYKVLVLVLSFTTHQGAINNV